MMDGTVAVYNIMLPTTVPQYMSNEVVQKHGGIVWEVKWSGITTGLITPSDPSEGNLAFYSASIDGKINHWVLNQNELGLTTIMTLYLDRPPIPGPDGTLITLKGKNNYHIKNIFIFYIIIFLFSSFKFLKLVQLALHFIQLIMIYLWLALKKEQFTNVILLTAVCTCKYIMKHIICLCIVLYLINITQIYLPVVQVIGELKFGRTIDCKCIRNN